MKDPYIDLASAIIKQAVDDLAAVETKIRELSDEIREREERGDEAEVLVKPKIAAGRKADNAVSEANGSVRCATL